MKPNRGQSSRPFVFLPSVGTQLVALIMMVIGCEAFFLNPPLPPPPYYHHPLPPPVEERPVTDYDDYVILSDDELVHDAAILQHLVLATKEEIEELVEDNPQIQTALLDKIRKVLDEKEALYHDSLDTIHQANPLKSGVHHHHHPKGEAFLKNTDDLVHHTKETLIHHPKKEKILNNYNNLKHSLKDQYHEELHHLHEPSNYHEDDPLQAGLDAAKVEMLRAKLKNKAAKLFKIGGSLKNRVLALKRRKLKDKKLRRHEEELEHEEAEEAAAEDEEAAALEQPGPVRPNFHFSVSTGR